MATDLVLFDGDKFELGFDSVIKVRLFNPKEANKAKENIIIVVADNCDSIKSLVETKKVDIVLIDPKRSKDFMRQRASGLNHIFCELAYRKDVAIAFSFNSVLRSSDASMLFGRIMQNIKLCRKYRVRMVFATFAVNKGEMRSYSDMLSFARNMGMTPKEAADSFNAYPKIAEEKKFYIREGVRKA